MQKNLVVFCVLLLLGGVFLSGCVSNDDKFVDAVTDLGNAAKPHLDLLNQSVGAHDFNASQEQCRQLITIYDTHIPLLYAINVSDKYQRPKQYMIAGFENERTGCRMLVNTTDDNLGPSMDYFLASSRNFSRAVEVWPD